MHSANSTTNWLKRFSSLVIALLIYQFSTAQDNSPYSRYGVGDLVPNQNIANRGMGGVSAAYSNFLSLNFLNPASLGNLSNTKNFANTIFELGGEVDMRSLKNTTVPGKYTSTNAIISYLQIGFPISTAKMERRKQYLGVSFGLRPVSRISYKLERNERLPGVDSLNTLFEGSGGINQANVSLGYRVKNFSVGVSSGYSFGNRDFSTKRAIANDSVIYYRSNSEIKSRFGAVFLNVGVQYIINMKNKSLLSLGAYSNLQQNMNAKQNQIDETFSYDANETLANIDTVNFKSDFKGKVIMPATYGAGFTYQDSNRHWVIGADFEFQQWDKYRYFGSKDPVQNSWTVRAGAEYYPASNNTVATKYWSFVKYRAGVYFGPDYIKLDKSRMNYAATLGASLPLTSAQRIRMGEYVLLNTAFEIGGRGSKNSSIVRENYLRFSLGVSMNARWFQKRSYD